MKNITWTTAGGANIAVTVTTDYMLDSQGRRKTAGEKQVIITATVGGSDHSCIMGIQPVTGHPTCVAKLGQIGLTAENHAAIQAAISAAKSEIAQHNADISAHAAHLDSLGNGDINTMFGKDA